MRTTVNSLFLFFFLFRLHCRFNFFFSCFFLLHLGRVSVIIRVTRSDELSVAQPHAQTHTWWALSKSTSTNLSFVSIQQTIRSIYSFCFCYFLFTCFGWWWWTVSTITAFDLYIIVNFNVSTSRIECGQDCDVYSSVFRFSVSTES